MPIDCDRLRAQADELRGLAAARMDQAVERGRYARTYVEDMTLVDQVEQAAELLDTQIRDHCE